MTSANLVRPSLASRRADVVITWADVVDSYLCLRYEVSPAPTVLRDGELLEGGGAGVAIDSKRHGCHDGRSAYRRSHTGAQVIGALIFGPTSWPENCSIAVLFAPFAHTAALHAHLCEVRLLVDDGRVRVVSARAA
ncbi:hypothetical protein [uncultured Jatrophihabitans sp.]|uniref:hypothetical protein n=1 Tax=uncultured Jatrophihabitans sp. TaxID=1610747 RepID=UPI0035C9984F